MNFNKIKKQCCVVLLVYLLLACLFYWIGGEQLRVKEDISDMISISGVVGEITKDTVFEQQLHVEGEYLSGISLIAATYARTNTGTLHFEILDLNRNILATKDIDISQLQDNAEFTLTFEDPIEVENNRVILRVTSPDCVNGNAVTLYYGNTMQASRYEVELVLSEKDRLLFNGQVLDYALCSRVISQKNLIFGEYYLYWVAIGFCILLFICVHIVQSNRKNRDSAIIRLISAFSRYQYLIKQLVARDFKTKYKRSALGVLWSFLNPLLTMLVQYLVFSTLFKSDIPNFIMYLLIGIICFNFFNEATGMCLMSIVGNASLITKVYVPKYIYPLTRVMSSTINFLLALIPLFIAMIMTREPIRPAILLLPIVIVCLFAFSLGIGMMLASSMVFFRDTQFLWGVICSLWMYATPIFYPESIIPAQFMTLYKMNPLYHIVRFMRTILIDGISPEPKAYALMLIASFVPLVVGVLVFKKTQDKFVLNL